MNLYKLLTDLEKVDEDIFDRLDSRRSVFKHFGGFGKKLAATAVPLALGSLFQKAYGKTSAIPDVLNYALTLEYLEYYFYEQGVNASGLIPAGAPTGAITTIRNHEKQHVDFLTAAITAAGATPVSFTANDFDYTASGNFPNVFSDYPTFLAIAQAFEDTGVRAYKGQATALMTDNDVLQAALQIHSVEARHAAHIRRMRRDGQNANQMPWITGNDRGGLPAAAQAVYAGEEVTTQAGVNIAGFAGISQNAASEAFDEPLAMAAVTNSSKTGIADLFIK